MKQIGHFIPLVELYILIVVCLLISLECIIPSHAFIFRNSPRHNILIPVSIRIRSSSKSIANTWHHDKGSACWYTSTRREGKTSGFEFNKLFQLQSINIELEDQDPDTNSSSSSSGTSIWLTPSELLQYVEETESETETETKCQAEENDDNNHGFSGGMKMNMKMDEDTKISKASSLFADVAYYFQCEGGGDLNDETKNGNQQDNLPIFAPSLYRLNPRLLQHKIMKMGVTVTSTPTPSNPDPNPNPDTPISQKDLRDIEEATERTYRWCKNFVEHLNLCPWAKLSLQSSNAIRIKIIHQDITCSGREGIIQGIDAMEQIIRDSALELMELTDENDGHEFEHGHGHGHGQLHGHVDANVGITFVIAIPRTGNESNHRHMWDFEFEQFYDFCIGLEDQLLDEAEDYLDESTPQAEAQDSVVPASASVSADRARTIGDEITIAPFHPDWSFASSSSSRNPLDYEKKSPYPTISLVRSSVIIKAGEEATGRIGIHNEEVLQKYGCDELEELYQKGVVLGPEN